MSERDQESTDENWLIVVYALVGVVGPLYVGIVHQDWVTGALLVALCFTSYVGFRVGSLRMLSLGAAGYAGCLYATDLGRFFEPQLQQHLQLSGLSCRVVAVTSAGIIIFVGFSLLCSVLVAFLHRQSGWLEFGDRWLGFVAGSIEGGVLGILFLSVALAVSPFAQQRLDVAEAEEQDGVVPGVVPGVAAGVVNLASSTRKSLLGPWLEQNNLWKQFPLLGQFENATIVMNDSAAMDELLEHPQVKALKDRPSVKRTIEQIDSDPELQKLFPSGQVDHASLLQLINHPNFMKIVDETKLLADVPEILEQIQPALEEVRQSNEP